MAQWVDCLLRRPDDLSSYPYSPCNGEEETVQQCPVPCMNACTCAMHECLHMYHA